MMNQYPSLLTGIDFLIRICIMSGISMRAD